MFAEVTILDQAKYQVIGRTPVFKSPRASKAPRERSSESADAHPGHSLSAQTPGQPANPNVL